MIIDLAVGADRNTSPPAKYGQGHSATDRQVILPTPLHARGSQNRLKTTAFRSIVSKNVHVASTVSPVSSTIRTATPPNRHPTAYTLPDLNSCLSRFSSAPVPASSPPSRPPHRPLARSPHRGGMPAGRPAESSPADLSRFPRPRGLMAPLAAGHCHIRLSPSPVLPSAPGGGLRASAERGDGCGGVAAPIQ